MVAKLFSKWLTLFLVPTLALLGQSAVERHRETESDRIEQRRQWFESMRNLTAVSQPSRLRREAALATRDRAMSANQFDVQRWRPAGPSRLRMLNWDMGNVSGRISAMAVNPRDSDILYIGGASGGLWRTRNGGQQWESLFDAVGTQTIGALALDPSNPDVIWVGTGDHFEFCESYFGQGIYVSRNGGASFQARNGQRDGGALSLSFIGSIAVDPRDGQRVFAGGHGFCENGRMRDGGLFLTDDGGETWTRLFIGRVQDVVIDPDRPHRVYAAVGKYGEANSGIARSLDGGQSWHWLRGGLPQGDGVMRCRIALAPSDARVLYALINRRDGGSDLYRSQDGGDRWRLVQNNACEGQCAYNLCLAVHPNDPNRLLLGSIRFAESRDGGRNLRYLTDIWGADQQVHQDTHVLLYDPKNPDRYWIGTDGGIWRGDSSQREFTNLNSNLNLTQFYDVALHPEDTHVFFGGSQDNSSSRRDSETAWDVTVATGDGFCNVVDPVDPDIVIQTSYPYGGLPSLVRSQRRGLPNTFRWLTPQGLGVGEPWSWKTPLTAAAFGGRSYLFTASDRVYVSTDHGDRWQVLSPAALGQTSITALAAVAFDERLILYAGSMDGEVFRCDHIQSTSPVWENVTGSQPPDGAVSDIAIMSNDPMHVYVTRSNFAESRLFVSRDGGFTWRGLDNGLPKVPLNTLSVHPEQPQWLFVGSDVGMFESIDGGKSFHTMMNGLPQGAVIMDLELDQAGERLVAASFGRGAWQVELVPPLQVDAGPDRSLCLDEALYLQATARQVHGEARWHWRILSGPATDQGLIQFPHQADPVFRPQVAGDYRFEVSVVDRSGRTVTDHVQVRVYGFYVPNPYHVWRMVPADAINPAEDRNGDGVVSILDYLDAWLAAPCDHIASENSAD